MSVLNLAYKKCLHLLVNVLETIPTYTPQAYPVARCRDAQTGGLIFLGGGDALR